MFVDSSRGHTLVTSASQPLPSQAQWDTGGYTQPVMMMEYLEEYSVSNA